MEVDISFNVEWVPHKGDPTPHHVMHNKSKHWMILECRMSRASEPLAQLIIRSAWVWANGIHDPLVLVPYLNCFTSKVFVLISSYLIRVVTIL